MKQVSRDDVWKMTDQEWKRAVQDVENEKRRIRRAHSKKCGKEI
jgi:hypothetical protein